MTWHGSVCPLCPIIEVKVNHLKPVACNRIPTQLSAPPGAHAPVTYSADVCDGDGTVHAEDPWRMRHGFVGVRHSAHRAIRQLMRCKLARSPPLVYCNVLARRVPTRAVTLTSVGWGACSRAAALPPPQPTRPLQPVS